MPSEAIVVALIAALPALIGALWQGWKTRAEVEQIRSSIERAAVNLDDTKSELRPNHGSSARDALDRIEADLGRLTDAIHFDRQVAEQRTRATWRAIDDLRAEVKNHHP